MSKKEVLEKIKELLKEYSDTVNVDAITETTNLNEIDINSLTIVQVLIKLEAELDIELDIEDMVFDNYSSLDEILQMVMNKL